MKAVEIWRRALECEDLGDLKTPEPAPTFPADAAEAREIAGYSELASGRPSCAVMNWELAVHAYKASGREKDAEAASGAVARVLESCFPPFKHVGELKAEVRAWAQARLRLLFGDGSVSTEGGELPIQALEEMRLHWVFRLRVTMSQLPDSPIALLARRLRPLSTRGFRGVGLRPCNAIRSRQQLSLLRPTWYGQDHDFGDHRPRVGNGPLSYRDQPGGEQVHWRDREELGPNFR